MFDFLKVEISNICNKYINKCIDYHVNEYLNYKKKELFNLIFSYIYKLSYYLILGLIMLFILNIEIFIKDDNQIVDKQIVDKQIISTNCYILFKVVSGIGIWFYIKDTSEKIKELIDNKKKSKKLMTKLMDDNIKLHTKYNNHKKKSKELITKLMEDKIK